MSKTWIQKGSDAAKDITAEWGMQLFALPIQLFPDLKEVAKREWAEEQGDTEYLSPDPKFRAYDMAAEFIYHGAINTAGNKVRLFCEYLTGAEFNIYDEDSDSGCRCRFMEYDSKAFIKGDALHFTLKLKINNPLSYAVKVTTSISKVANCAMSVYWSDGTKADYANNAAITKTFSGFGVVVPTKIGRI